MDRRVTAHRKQGNRSKVRGHPRNKRGYVARCLTGVIWRWSSGLAGAWWQVSADSRDDSDPTRGPNVPHPALLLIYFLAARLRVDSQSLRFLKPRCYHRIAPRSRITWAQATRPSYTAGSSPDARLGYARDCDQALLAGHHHERASRTQSCESPGVAL